MTDNPVAAANARTRWKRETPAIAAISSRLNGPARWLSIYQSAFWAGFIADGFPSKHPHHARLPRASFDSRCSRGGESLFRSAEIADSRNNNRPAGNTIPIVHTACAAFDPTAHQAASQ